MSHLGDNEYPPAECQSDCENIVMNCLIKFQVSVRSNKLSNIALGDPNQRFPMLSSRKVFSGCLS